MPDIKRMMQEKIDGLLADEQIEELLAHLAEDEEAAAEYQRLEELDYALMAAPHVRAPQRLAVTIMARLADAVQTQADLQPLSQETKQALLLSISLVMVSMMPVMMSASYMVMYAGHSPKLLNQVMYQVVELMLLMIEALNILLSEVERTIHEHPEAAPIALALIPMTLMSMLEYIEGYSSEELRIA